MVLAFTLLFFLSHPAGSTAACVQADELLKIRGISLSGILPDGQTIHLLKGYYGCHEPKRGDVIAYHYSGHEELLAKIVKAVPGDQFHLEAAPGGWHVRVNHALLTNSAQDLYLLSDASYRILVLYERDYSGIIPPGAYLIFGNLPGGTLDSSRFGLINKSDIIGKIVPIPGPPPSS